MRCNRVGDATRKVLREGALVGDAGGAVGVTDDRPAALRGLPFGMLTEPDTAICLPVVDLEV